MSKPIDDNLSDSDGSEGWDDVNEGDDEMAKLDVVSLLDDKIFPDAAAMLAHCKDKFHFDFVATRDRLGLDFLGSIKLVNFGTSPSTCDLARGRNTLWGANANSGHSTWHGQGRPDATRAHLS